MLIIDPHVYLCRFFLKKRQSMPQPLNYRDSRYSVYKLDVAPPEMLHNRADRINAGAIIVE